MFFRKLQDWLFLGVAALLVAMAACEMCSVELLCTDGDVVSIRFTDSIAFIVLMAVPFVLNIIGICNFRRPAVQLRMATVSLIILVAFQIWVAVFFFRMKDVYVFSIATVYPVVCAILDFLAARTCVSELSKRAALEIYSTMDKAKKNQKHE